MAITQDYDHLYNMSTLCFPNFSQGAFLTRYIIFPYICVFALNLAVVNSATLQIKLGFML